MDLLITPKALKDLAAVPTKERAAILAEMKGIAADPFRPRSNVKPLVGRRNEYRLRKGDWRAIYRVEANIVTVTLFRVANRKDAYS